MFAHPLIISGYSTVYTDSIPDKWRQALRKFVHFEYQDYMKMKTFKTDFNPISTQIYISDIPV